MTTYVAMLRGINVSGRNTLAMGDLRDIVVAAGGGDVQTYIQSGNAVFSSRRSASALTASLESGLESTLESSVAVLVRTKEELEVVIRNNPFVRRREAVDFLHVTFMAEVPDPVAVAAISRKRDDADELRVIGREVYLLCPNGYGKSKLTNAFFERKLASAATTRNWKTVTKLVELARG